MGKDILIMRYIEGYKLLVWEVVSFVFGIDSIISHSRAPDPWYSDHLEI